MSDVPTMKPSPPDSIPEPQPGCPGGPAMNPPLSEAERLRAILESPAYRLAYEDMELLTQKDLRPLRLQLELLKPERVLGEQGVHSTVVVFGRARIHDAATSRNRLADLERQKSLAAGNPALERALTQARRRRAPARYPQQPRRSAHQRPARLQQAKRSEFDGVTGGGPGCRGGANRGA